MPSKDNSVASCAQQILTQVKTVVVGKDPVLLWVLAAILARGHILLEDIPGVGKTTMALAFSRVLSLSCSRVQFTPDVLPSDVTGYSVPDSAGGMRYQPGAVLCNLFLADELNRATSRTQSALLEAMEEGQVTVDGVSHPLPKPFTVIATQNPTGAAGTQLLPDSQMDRFMVRLSMGYPSPKDEAAMVLNRQGGNPPARPDSPDDPGGLDRHTGHGGGNLPQRQRGQLYCIPHRRHPEQPRHPSGRKPPCDAGCHRHGEIRRPASGTGLRDPGGREGGLRPHHRPPPDFIPQSGSTGKAAAGGIAGHPCRRPRPPASLT